MAHIAIGEVEGLEWQESVICARSRAGSAEELVPEAEGEGPGMLPVVVRPEVSDTAWLESVIDDDEQLGRAEQRGLLGLIDESIEPEARSRDARAGIPQRGAHMSKAMKSMECRKRKTRIRKGHVAENVGKLDDVWDE